VGQSLLHNLLVHPTVTVEVGGETFRAREGVTEGTDRDRLFAQRAVHSPNFTKPGSTEARRDSRSGTCKQVPR
jgi:hypothetical protein